MGEGCHYTEVIPISAASKGRYLYTGGELSASNSLDCHVFFDVIISS